jgi:hypothetical protein
MERGLLGALGIFIALFCGLFAVMFTVEAATGGDGKTSPGVYAGLIVFFAGGFVVGAYLAWRMFRSRPPASGTTRPDARHPGRGTRSARPTPAAESAEPAAEPAAAPAASPENRVLRFAEKEHGRVTIAEVAARCDLTVSEAKAILDGFVVQEVAALHVTDGGVLVYVFAGFLSDEDKARAEDF